MPPPLVSLTWHDTSHRTAMPNFVAEVAAGGGSTANHFVNAHSWPLFRKTAGESGMFATWNTMPLESAEAHFSLAL